MTKSKREEIEIQTIFGRNYRVINNMYDPYTACRLCAFSPGDSTCVQVECGNDEMDVYFVEIES